MVGEYDNVAQVLKLVVWTAFNAASGAVNLAHCFSSSQYTFYSGVFLLPVAGFLFYAKNLLSQIHFQLPFHGRFIQLLAGNNHLSRRIFQPEFLQPFLPEIAIFHGRYNHRKIQFFMCFQQLQFLSLVAVLAFLVEKLYHFQVAFLLWYNLVNVSFPTDGDICLPKKKYANIISSTFPPRRYHLHTETPRYEAKAIGQERSDNHLRFNDQVNYRMKEKEKAREGYMNWIRLEIVR